MGRPDPCVLFAQTFTHQQLDEFVDEVIFAEPVVITACEFLEQNASSASPVITLVGSTSPPSFALEVFVQCEGEPRFRRLCQPFLYSHSSSNVLEVEAVVTSHLVVRGSYRSLTLMVYGNTAEDLGQFNIEFDLDSSLASLVCSPSEGKLEDLPLALRSAKLTLEETIFSLKSLSLPVAEPNLSLELKQFLQLILRVLDISEVSDVEDSVHNVLDTVVSAISSYVASDLRCTTITSTQCKVADSTHCREEVLGFLIEGINKLQELEKRLANEYGSLSDELFGDGDVTTSQTEALLASTVSELLPDLFKRYFFVERESPTNGIPLIAQNKSVILGLSVVLLLCSGKDSCFHFVNCGGMELLARVIPLEMHKSPAVTLMLLGVIERATRYSIGCEGLLGWWGREGEDVPVANSEGYCQILKLLMQKQRHDVASLATYVLHRLRSFEVASRYESVVLNLLEGFCSGGKITSGSLDLLICAKFQLKKLLNLLNSRGPIEDPSPLAHASRFLMHGQTEGLLSYKATIDLITSSNCCFSKWDIDPFLLSLLKERGFLPLSAALLASTVLRSEKEPTMNIMVDIASSIEAIMLSLLFCRSGLMFLLVQPEITATVIHSFLGVEDTDNQVCVTLRYASVLISKGFLCRPQDIGMITELHLRMVNAIDRLLVSNLSSEELLWVLWELCDLSRSDSGREALLVLEHFPEAVLVLVEALRSAKELEAVALNSGGSPLNLAIFHSAAEIFEVIVTDSTASSLGTWIRHASELHKALHSSSPGSNRKDTPTRLLEWIDAGVVYERNGASGLLRFASILASGGDAHLTSSSILVSDSMDVENVIGDSASSDIQVIDNLLGKLVSDKYFDGVALRESSVAQLTTTFRILAFISENSAVAATLYEEGAVTLIFVVLVNCKYMLERSSNSYDYLVDEGAECNSTSDLLSERSREQSLVDLMIPCLVLLITLLQKLQESKEHHRNTKLLNALLRLHREVSPKLAACAADLSSPYPSSALGFGAACHLLVSAISCWPIFNWTPGLFPCVLDSVQATSLLALGPKEACSLLCLLGDLFPEEGIWLWKNGTPSLSALRTLAIGTLLGPLKERQINWYLQPGHASVLLNQLAPLLDKIAQLILNIAFTALVVIQDMLRVFLIRIACQKVESAIVLLRPIISWIRDHVSQSSPPSDLDAFKVFRLLDFLASLLEHPRGKALLLKEGFVPILTQTLEWCSFASNIEEAQGKKFSLLSWCLPVSKSLTLICDSQTSVPHSGIPDNCGKLSAEDYSLILHHLLNLCRVLPVGKELLACLIAFRKLAICSEGRSAFASISVQIQSASCEDLEKEREMNVDGGESAVDNGFNWQKCMPLLHCWKSLVKAIDNNDSLSIYALEAVNQLSLGALSFCVEGKNLNLEGVAVLKVLFGLPFDLKIGEHAPEEKLKDIIQLKALLKARISKDEDMAPARTKNTLSQIKEIVEALLLILQTPTDSINVDDLIFSEGLSLFSTDVLDISNDFPPHFSFPSLNMTSVINEDDEQIPKSDCSTEMAVDQLFPGELGDNFVWDCPDTLRDRLSSLSALSAKRKATSMEMGPNRRSRIDNSGAEIISSNVFTRASSVSSGPTRRDSFRHRKPNTSRPPSMHVDDYVARERNIDGVSSSSNVVSSFQRGGSTGGRPPSIHVDEFIARQKGERQLPVGVTVGDSSATQLRNHPEKDAAPEKLDKSRQLKADLDDDLQEINIVFDDEESEPGDRLLFPQADNKLDPVAPLVVEGENSPHSIVEETGSEVSESTQVSNLGVNESAQSDFSSRLSVSRPEMPLSREESISSEQQYVVKNTKKPFFHEQPPVASSGFDNSTMASLSGFPMQFHNKGSLGDSRMPPFYPRDRPQQETSIASASNSHGLYGPQKIFPNQPPLPPMPPPPAVSPVLSQNPENVQNRSSPYRHPASDVQPPLPTVPYSHPRDDRASPSLHNFHSNLSTFSESPNEPFNNNSQSPLATSQYSWVSVSSSASGSIRPLQPPLPPTPPPFSIPSTSQPSMKNSNPLTSYSPPQLVPPPLMMTRPLSIPGTLFSHPIQHQSQNQLSMSVHPRPQLQPLQPPQPPQHLRPPGQPSELQPEQGVAMLQSPIQVHGQLFHMQQPPQMSPMQVYYHSQQQELLVQSHQQHQVEQARPQVLYQQEESGSQSQDDSGMSLQQYFASPEAIQSLLSDRHKLCELLERYPKLMQMLEEKLKSR
ncbi:hypothetical protein GIB67_003014 [Kingdonia uniflora]|uniref:Virilizer N-terminal domain-containing protein n=1 Tax=Kingdonia uniflora TaxID=39325 RepID=A0A7J7LYI9_9MAGN|nr:hypothetical protein GIB67_003014 [Kingdonia uniflora]